jgi:hypothetical protein
MCSSFFSNFVAKSKFTECLISLIRVKAAELQVTDHVDVMSTPLYVLDVFVGSKALVQGDQISF